MRVVVVEHEADCPPGLLAAPLEAAGAVLDVRRPYAGDALPSGPGALDDVDALLVLGGQMASWDDDGHPWLPATRALLATAVASGVPTLGVCLGAQLLAAGTGGRVERGTAGAEAGLLPVRATPAGLDDALVAAVVADAGGPQWRVPQSHVDTVTQLPPDAVLLATGDHYAVQALRVGERAWGVQYHPEVTPAELGVWIAEHESDLVARGTTVSAELDAVRAAAPELARLARAHARVLAGAAAERAALR